MEWNGRDRWWFHFIFYVFDSIISRQIYKFYLWFILIVYEIFDMNKFDLFQDLVRCEVLL